MVEGVSRKSRKNGWTIPWHSLQVFSWSLFVIFAVLEFALLIPAFKSTVARILNGLIFVPLVLALLVSKIVATTIDPSDDSVRRKLSNRRQPQFDADKHAQVISDEYFCHICEEIVHPSSKHCRQCNKCVLGFDHHCKWLNNCVGERNYGYFLAFVVATALNAGGACVQCGLIIGFFYTNNSVLHVKQGMLTLFGKEISGDALVPIIVFLGVTCFVTCILTVHLLGFHWKLLKQGITTYGYIIERRDDSRTRGESENKAGLRCCGNKQTPANYSTNVANNNIEQQEKNVVDNQTVNGAQILPTIIESAVPKLPTISPKNASNGVNGHIIQTGFNHTMNSPSIARAVNSPSKAVDSTLPSIRVEFCDSPTTGQFAISSRKTGLETTSRNTVSGRGSGRHNKVSPTKTNLSQIAGEDREKHQSQIRELEAETLSETSFELNLPSMLAAGQTPALEQSTAEEIPPSIGEQPQSHREILSDVYIGGGHFTVSRANAL